MRMTLLTGLVAVTAAVLAAAATASPYAHLQPGQTASLAETVPVNIVLVGFDESDVPAAGIRAGLPSTSKPVVRSRLWYGNVERLGLSYTYDYRFHYTSGAWEDAFFGALGGLATPAPRTLFQDIYNSQDGTRDIGQNHYIDAPSVEKWLAANPPAGVDTRQNTIFYVNWWGRSDFVDHVYTKFGEPDPDTGYDFGNRHSRKIVAWGGTTPDDAETGLGALGTHRIWFYDLSAGPESWGGSYDVDHEDIPASQYRIPNSWEYGTPGYRPASMLPTDLGLVTRYVALNLLFTSSPLYPPYLTPGKLPQSINLDSNTYDSYPGVDAALELQSPDVLLAKEQGLFPIPMTVDTQDVAFTGQSRYCYETWIYAVYGEAEQPCWNNFPYPAWANLYVDNALRINRLRDGGGEYEAIAANYATDDFWAPPYLGFADDNWYDGTQSMIFNFVSPFISEVAGYGLTTTQIHEWGHHFGMSHPHDGYDPETGRDYGPSGPFFFAWLGDETNSMMSYIDLNWDFSQFDRDNAARHQAAGYVTNANAIAAEILASKKASRAAADLAAADALVGASKSALAAHDYPATWNHARAAYLRVLSGAGKAGVKVTASSNGWTVQRPGGPRNAVAQEYAAKDAISEDHKRAQR